MSLPKIWYSRILTSIEVITGLDYDIFGDPMEYIRASERWEILPNGRFPSRLFFMKGERKIKASARDAFVIPGHHLVVSPMMHDVLKQFDMGRNRIVELEIYRSDKETLSDYPPHYLVHIAETKPTLIPEKSENIERSMPPGETEPRPGARWHDTYDPDQLAVRASSAEGADLWADTILESRLFFSDRLKQAIQAAKPKSRGLKFVAAEVLP